MPDTSIQVAGTSTVLTRPETFAPRTLDEALKFANIVLESGLIPKSYVGKSPAAIVVAIQFGMELGMQPLQSLQNIASINGQPGVWGDAALALVLSSGLCEYYEEDDFETIKKNEKATFVVKRRGFPKPKTTTFSYADAKSAGIITNAVWKTYPFRMCQMRARSFGLRDSFPDVLKGMELAEALQDYPGETIEGANSTASSSAPATPATEKQEEVIGQAGGSAFYKTYKASGWTADEAKKWLSETLLIGEPHNKKDSRDIPVKEWKSADGQNGGRAWAFASSPSPIKQAITETFDSLDFSLQERIDFFAQHKDFPAVHEALIAEVNKRNKAELG
jgi:hypothetical protein